MYSNNKSEFGKLPNSKLYNNKSFIKTNKYKYKQNKNVIDKNKSIKQTNKVILYQLNSKIKTVLYLNYKSNNKVLINNLFGLYPVWESIFTYLNINDILNARLVSKCFNNHILNFYNVNIDKYNYAANKDEYIKQYNEKNPLYFYFYCKHVFNKFINKKPCLNTNPKIRNRKYKEKFNKFCLLMYNNPFVIYKDGEFTKVKKEPTSYKYINNVATYTDTYYRSFNIWIPYIYDSNVNLNLNNSITPYYITSANITNTNTNTNTITINTIIK